MIGRELLCLEDRHLAGPDIGRADEDLDIRAGAHPIEVDERVDRVPQRIDVERVRLVGTEAWRDDVRPGLAPEAQHQAEKPRWAGERDPSRLARRQNVSSALRAPSIPPSSQPSTITTAFIAPALAPVIASTAEAAVFEEGVEHAPREGAVGPAALQGQRHGLFGARPGERRSRPDGVEHGPSSRRPTGSAGEKPCLGH